MATAGADTQAVRLILWHFRGVKDPRVARTRRHPLSNVLVMGLCAAVCGADGFKAMAAFARSRARFFRRFVTMPHGTPSADTFRRVFAALNPQAFEKAFRAWIGALAQEVNGQVVALDGKAVRGALRAGAGGPLHLVHAWAAEQRLVLAQQAVTGAPGEVAAIAGLIGALQLEGAVVTVDANGCTRQVAQACVEAKAHYVLALKGNRGPLHAFVQALFLVHAWQQRLPSARGRTGKKREQAHGRYEVRQVWALNLRRWPVDWPGLRSAVLVCRQRQVPGQQVQVTWHTYVSSLPAHASKLARAIRKHWDVENGLHWVLDVGFGEDRRRVRHQTAAQNLARLHRLALTLLQRETSARMGIALKRQQAGWDTSYLLRVLSVGLPSD